MSENKRVTIPFLEKVLKPIVDLVHTKADKKDVYAKTELANVAVSGSYTDLNNTPTLAAVATSGIYADLNGTPELAAVATSGSYTDLSDMPVPDATLSVDGAAADAKATGDAVELARAKAEITHYCPGIVLDTDVKILYKPGVTEIGVEEYRGNTDYDVAYFPDVVTVSSYAFEQSSVRYAIFPKATMVQAGAFLRCENLQYAYFPSLVEARRNSFGSTGIMHADFPALETVGEQYTGNVFAYCESLVSINMPKLKSAFVDGGTHFKGNQKLTDVNLPELECAAGQMFDGCVALTKLDLPKAISIGRRAFQESGIETLILRSETVATLVHTNAFTGTPIASGTGYIYVPAALIDSYKTAANWSTYATQFRAIEDYPEICGEINLTVSMLDDTLSVEGAPADAKAVGDALAETGVWYVHATANDDGSFTLDKTYDEIIAAYDAGRKVQCEMRFAADAGAGAYIFDLIAFGPYVPDVNDGDTVYNGALFVLWMQNRMMRMLVTTDNQVMMFQTNRFQTEGELQIRYGNELMYAGHMGVDVDIDLNIPINAPKDYIALRDHTNGYTYLVGMVNGKLVSTLEISELEIASHPNTMVYTAGDDLDLTGLVVNAVRYDGSKTENIQVTHNAPSPLSTDVTSVTLSYNEFGKIYTVELPITVEAFAEEAILVDFDYTDNGDGTYTLTGWKGTNQGVESTEMIIPNYSSIIL